MVLGFRLQGIGLGFRVQASMVIRFRLQGLGFRVL
jgi:hypothetical protein